MKKLISVALVLVLALSLSVAAFAAGTTVYCDAPDDWTACYVHAWGDAGDLTGGWPGATATLENGLWKFDVPAGATKVIFHNNAGTQTADLDMPTDNKVKYDMAAKTWAAINETPEVVEIYTVAGTGSLCGDEWKPELEANKMTKGSDGVWTKEFKNVAAGEHKFKVTDGSWTNSWGDPADADGNVVFTLANAGNVTIKFAPATKTVTLIADGKTTEYKPAEEGGDNTQATTAPSGSTNTTTAPTTAPTTSGGSSQPADPTPSGRQSNYRVVGSAEWMGNWDPASDKGRMVEVETGVYKVNFKNVPAGTYQMKVTNNGSWAESWGDNGENYSFTVKAACDITVTFTLKNNVGVIHVKGTGVEDPGTGDIPMVGVIALMVLAATTTVVLVVNKKRFI